MFQIPLQLCLSDRGPRYASEYTIRESDGNERIYEVGATDASLPRGLPVGTDVKKLRWQVSYEENGQRVDGIGLLAFYVTVLSLGLGLVVWGRRCLLDAESAT